MLSPGRILLIQLRRFGDVVITTALASDLRQAFPRAELHFMVGQAAAPLLQHHPHLDNIFVFQPKRLRAMVAEVRRRKYDWLIDVQVHPRTAILSWLSGVPVRVGWDARFWGNAYTHRTARDSTPMYMAANRRRLLQLVGVQTGESLPRLYLSDEERQQARADAESYGLDLSRPLVGIGLGAQDLSKGWTIDGFADLTSTLAGGNVQVVLFRFPGELELENRFLALTGAATVVEWEGDRRFLGMLELCDVFASADTGPSHMALALGVPRVTVFGPTSAVLWSPGLPTTVAVLNPRQACLGCGLKPCPIDRACIRGVRADEVAAAVFSLLRSESAQRSRIPR
jgi:ADP-heptose:LPS heptosyltransferase